MVQVGDVVVRRPATFYLRDEEDNFCRRPKKRSHHKEYREHRPMDLERAGATGTVCFVHPTHHWYTVAFPTPGGVIRESFKGDE